MWVILRMCCIILCIHCCPPATNIFVHAELNFLGLADYHSIGEMLRILFDDIDECVGLNR